MTTPNPSQLSQLHLLRATEGQSHTTYGILNICLLLSEPRLLGTLHIPSFPSLSSQPGLKTLSVNLSPHDLQSQIPQLTLDLTVQLAQHQIIRFLDECPCHSEVQILLVGVCFQEAGLVAMVEGCVRTDRRGGEVRRCWEVEEEGSGLVVAPREEEEGQMPVLASRSEEFRAAGKVVLRSTEDAQGSGERYGELVEAVRQVFDGLETGSVAPKAAVEDVESSLRKLKLDRETLIGDSSVGIESTCYVNL
ncbi:hypothetical protein GE09DRAFT_1067863 [Coniochaeta sp. 2T2.1]|nr:hypothetical protein GE09DRAFT_1067863 [Coniochaeta sp. 2T2.1]